MCRPRAGASRPPGLSLLDRFVTFRAGGTSKVSHPRIEAIVNPGKISRADIVVGIPSYNEADSIAFPTEMVDKGLVQAFPDKECLIVNVDNHSPDGTREAFLSVPTRTAKMYVTTPAEKKGKGRNILNFMEVAVHLGAKALVMVDADLKSITTQWMEYLCRPLLDGYDYVLPIYVRHKYDGTITNNIAYPMMRTLYGRRLRQPIGGDFGLSGRLARCLLTEKTQTTAIDHFGIDIWMTTVAVGRLFNVCQTFMGTPKDHRAKDPGAHLGPMFKEVVGTIFQLMIDFEYIWKDEDLTGSKPGIIYGFGLGQSAEVPEVKVDRGRLYESFRRGFEEYEDLWRRVLHGENFQAIEALEAQSVDEFYYPSELWARIVFDYAVSYREGEADRDTLLESLLPFYHSRTLSFVNKTVEMDTRQAEFYLDNINKVFEGEKDYLVRRWNAVSRRGGASIAPLL